MLCQKCHKEIDDNSKFCSFCGNKKENIEDKEIETKNLKESISSNLETKQIDIDENKSSKNLIVKGVIYRLVALAVAYVAFIALKVGLVAKGISFEESTFLGVLIFLSVYKLIVGFLLKIKSSKKIGIWLIIISVVLVFVSVRYEPKISTSSVEKELNYLKNQTPKKLDENTTLLNLDINSTNVAFEYYINNVSIDNMTPESQRIFTYTVKKELCTTPIFIEVMKENYNIDIKYLDKNYYIIGKVKLSKNECK